MKILGYSNRILKIDLSSKDIKTIETPSELKRKYLGGRGFGSKILHDITPPGLDPFSPRNPVIFSVGPLTGTLSPSSSRYTVTTKSPATGILGDANSGGFFGAEIKYAGYDSIIITGKSDKPVYILITDDVAEIKDASHIWGKDVFFTTDAVTKDHGREYKIVCIGQAGENKVRYAGIMNEKYRAAARCGVGAVMGSKNLKALAVMGTNDLEPKEPEKFLKKVIECFEKIRSDKIYPTFSQTGTPMLIDIANEQGGLSTRNGQDGIFDEIEKVCSYNFEKNYKTHNKGCFSCIIHCSNFSKVPDGNYACETEGPEYETMVCLGTRVGIDDLEAIIKANYLCNLYGLDTISTGTCIAFLMEAYERGLYKTDLKLDWGNKDIVLELIEKIAFRKDIGDFLADGVREMKKRIPGSEAFALEARGLESPAFDVRTAKGFALGLAMASRGVDHLRALPNFELLNYTPKEGIKLFGEPDTVDPYTNRGKPEMVKWHEEFAAVVDSAETCKYCCFTTYAILPQDLAELINFMAGTCLDSSSILKIGERIINEERLYNLREGLTSRDDTLPKRFLNDPLPRGPAKGQTVNLRPMVEEYYRLRGWDENGVPLKEKIQELEMGRIWNED